MHVQGEPNDVGTGEDAVEIDFRERLTRKGEWNDATQAEDYEMVRAPSSNSTATSILLLVPLIDWSWALAVPALRDSDTCAGARRGDELGHADDGVVPCTRLH